jgi:hypothetical protein
MIIGALLTKAVLPLRVSSLPADRNGLSGWAETGSA